MTDFAARERAALADLFDELGPDAPTLCEGWAARDLAAHLVLRERRPDAAPGIVFKPLSGYTERVQARVAATPWPELVARYRSGPPPWLRPFDETANLVEMFVHHEDLRRGGSGWSPRDLDPALGRALTARLRGLSRMLLRRSPVGVVASVPDQGLITLRSGDPAVTITGGAGEVVLYVFGRKDAARVELSGPDDAVRRFREASLGL
ncbi:MAG TPA: TIGR03085 family metal-binding protein [Acidimicrobiales bacterium]|nr:TIGR03085 family metal-binding protein [Acidimicrobiales bacterium]